MHPISMVAELALTLIKLSIVVDSTYHLPPNKIGGDRTSEMKNVDAPCLVL